MKKQAGFTLIELVIVIIILGILAVTAAPKFLNLQDDARKAAADGVKASLQSSSQLVYSKAAILGIEGTSGAVSVAGTTVNTKFGYPLTTDAGKTVALDGWSEVSGTPGTFKPSNEPNSKCAVTYANTITAVGGVPSIAVSTECGK
ncbi:MULTISPECIES: prepilin-type N-terminal cleavage/methylation domain-containing protein [Aeromonas]|uniref:prepilin-type N-terminal cleavage/methylation domain-containing protein n=1 Tax=Aeromonas TaxID=642 RepID=UPI0011174E41|nr:MULTISPECIES: prepilin-type N-terminal cleavage/methylation domain-containing protein [Aeromonas]KAJ8741238.1 prepilin-type N-terminal cleavage/methylation domain-containing protein [Aeromonas veronii]MCV3285198.1 prepilin-type N-terminal cleavage/methylation domain-containing protein [Aeromonas veronii]MDA3317225.1 prepilin-type N-terminal cleavage/methylation domain-containing protein [Aeromonas sp. PI_26]QXB30400.1 prepilin-type N-terminal cleavage/methylation domain-containing protein [A